MKKRLICMLLSVLVIVSLFAGISVSASAETVSYSTMTYRMVSGDYVLRICQRLGLNYYVCKTSIMKLNNITNEDQFRHLAVGKLLTLPSTDADAVVITTGHGSTAKTTTTATTNTAVTSTIAAATPTKATVSASSSGDPIWFWIVPYELRSGETISDAMNALGMEGNAFRDTIQKINQIKDWGSSRTNSSILLPTYYPPASGFSRVTVYAHVMRAGETPANVVTSRGLDYTKIKPMLDILNEKYGGVANVQTGQRLFYPIASTGKVYGDDSAEGYYKLNSGLSTADGTVEFYVNDKRVYSAKPGTTVKFVLKPASGKAVKDVVLKFANGQADLYLKGNSFTMPSCDVRLDASFQSGHKITVTSDPAGKTVARVDGVNVSSAAKGARVMVASNDSTLALSEVYVSYMTLTGLKREQLTNIDNGFVMPDADVTIEAVLKDLPTYPFYIINNAANNFGAFGSYSLQVDGNSVTGAARGTQVKIVPTPDTGYTIGQIMVTRHDNGQNVGVYNNTFVMPNVGVDVFVRFDPKGNNILMNPVEGGEFWATLGGQNVKANAVDEAGTNVQVFLNAQLEPGYALSTNPDDYVVKRNKDGNNILVTVNVLDDGTVVPSFRMPAGGATVTGGVQRAQRTYSVQLFFDNNQIPAGQFRDLSFYTKGSLAKDANGNPVNDSNGDLERYEFQSSGAPVVPANSPAAIPAFVGEYITLSYSGGKSIWKGRYEVWSVDDTGAPVAMLAEQTTQADNSNCFMMPNQNVVIRAYFSSNIINPSLYKKSVSSSGTIGVMDVNGNSVAGVKAGEPFAITLSPSKGYFFDTNPADGKDRIVATRKDNKGDLPLMALDDPRLAALTNPNPAQNPYVNDQGETVYVFDRMPDCGVDVYVTFDKMPYVLQLNGVDEDGNVITGSGFWRVKLNGTWASDIRDNNTSVVSAKYGDTVEVGLTDAGASRYAFVRCIVNNNVILTSNNQSFTITGELADVPNQIIPITLVVKDKVVDNYFTLSATSNGRGNASFFVLQSPNHPEGVSLTNYATKAYAGDTVAILPKAVTPADYVVDADNIRVNRKSGGTCLITEDTTTKPGTTLYTFVMPEEGYSSIYVPFVPRKYNVTAGTNPANAALGLFQISYNDGSSNDVLLDNTFKSAPVGSMVRVTLTDAGIAKNVHIDTKTSLDNLGNGIADVDKGYYGNGFCFKMPSRNVSFTVYLLDKNNETTLVPRAVAEPTAATITMPTSFNGVTVQYSYLDGTLITDAKVKSGENVKVTVLSGVGDGQVLDNIEYKVGTTPVAKIQDGGTLTVPDSTPTATATVRNKQYSVRIGVENAPETYTIKVDGQLVSAGTTLTPNKEYDTTMTIAVTGDRDIDSVTNLTGGTLSAKELTNGKLEPDASVEDKATVDVTIKFKVAMFDLTTRNSMDSADVTFYDEAGNVITQAADGQTVYVSAEPDAKTNYATAISIDSTALEYNEAKGAYGPYTVTKKVEFNMVDVTMAAKTVTVQVVCQYEDGTSAEDRIDAFLNGNPAAKTITGVKKDDVVTAKRNVDGTTIKKVEGENFSAPYFTSGDTYADCTIDTTNVNNGDTITITVTAARPAWNMPDKAADGETGLKYYDADGNPIANPVTEGTEMYIKATTTIYKEVKSVAIGSQTLTKKANGTYGPYTLTKNLAPSDIAVETAEKAITLVFDYQSEPDTAPVLEWNGAAQSSNTTIGNVTNSGTVQIGQLELKLSGTDSFGTVDPGKGVAVDTKGAKSVKFKFDPATFADIADGATVTIKVYFEAP